MTEENSLRQDPQHQLREAVAVQHQQIIHDIKMCLKTVGTGPSLSSLVSGLGIPLEKAKDTLEFAEQAIVQHRHDLLKRKDQLRHAARRD